MSETRIAVADLGRRTAAVSPEADLARESIGAALNLALIDRYGADSLVFGAGPLAGSLAPASALLVGSFAAGHPGAAARSASSASVRHVPLLLTAGSDFRCSGIDHLVLQGAAERPTLIHIDSGRIRFVEMPSQGADPFPSEAWLRRSAPPCRSAILNPPAAEKGVPFASVSIGLRGSLDKAGLAGAMAAKNLKGILLGGSGGVDLAREDLNRSLEITGKIGRLQRRAGGFASLVAADGGGDILRALTGSRFQAAACFHCPAPCMVHARFSGSAVRSPQGPKRQEGVLLMDHRGFIALARKRGKGALPMLAEAVRLGLDPCAAAALLPPAGTAASDTEAVNSLARGGTACLPTAFPQPAGLTFGGGLPLIATRKEALRRTALAFALGVCPLFLLRFPEIAGDLAVFVPADVTPEIPERSAERILARG